MFEKEAEEYANRFWGKKESLDRACTIDNFKDGAEFGYNKAKEEMIQNGLALQSDMDKTIEQNIALKKELNKANEWHYPSKGEYPKEYEDILICFLTEDDMRDCVYGWYEYDFENDKHIFKYINVLGTQYLKTEIVIAWKEIVLPEEVKEND